MNLTNFIVFINHKILFTIFIYYTGICISYAGLGEAIIKENFLSLNVINSSDIVCMGTLLKMEVNEFETIKKINDPNKIEGIQYNINFKVDEFLKGSIENKLINIHFSYLLYAVYPFNLAEGKKYLIFLTKDHQKNKLFFYNREENTTPWLLLPEAQFNLNKDLIDYNEKLKAVLYHTTIHGNIATVSFALKTLEKYDANFTYNDAYGNILSENALESKVYALSEKIRSEDLSALKSAIKIINSFELSDEGLYVLETAISEIRDVKFKLELIELTKNDNISIRDSAFLALSRYYDKDLTFLMIKALDNENSRVRLRAIHYLSNNHGPIKVSGETVPFSRRDNNEVKELWKKWWDENKEIYLQN